MKSEPINAHASMKPATVDPKVKICTIEVGSVWTLMKLLPLTPATIPKVTKTGIQAHFANLNNIRITVRLFQVWLPILTS